MTPDDLFIANHANDRAADPNPFIEPDALNETQLLEVRYDGVRSTLGILLELRVSFHSVSTGLIVASGVTDLAWKQVDRRGMRTAWTVVGSTPARGPAGMSMALAFLFPADLRFTADSATFHLLRIPHLEGIAPPDYGEPDFAEVRRGLATWQTDCELVASAHS
jgi:hypothetical protein